MFAIRILPGVYDWDGQIVAQCRNFVVQGSGGESTVLKPIPSLRGDGFVLAKGNHPYHAIITDLRIDGARLDGPLESYIKTTSDLYHPDLSQNTEGSAPIIMARIHCVNDTSLGTVTPEARQGFVKHAIIAHGNEDSSFWEITIDGSLTVRDVADLQCNAPKGNFHMFGGKLNGASLGALSFDLNGVTIGNLGICLNGNPGGAPSNHWQASFNDVFFNGVSESLYSPDLADIVCASSTPVLVNIIGGVMMVGVHRNGRDSATSFIAGPYAPLALTTMAGTRLPPGNHFGRATPPVPLHKTGPAYLEGSSTTAGQTYEQLMRNTRHRGLAVVGGIPRFYSPTAP